MKNNFNNALGWIALKRVFYLVSMIAMFSLVSLPVSQVMAKQEHISIEAEISGVFGVTGVIGESVLFIVEESGGGTEPTLGSFNYSTFLMHNLAHAPPDCGPLSSTGIGGSASLVFANGSLRLKRTSGVACITGPTIRVEEHWVIASGTGEYIDASGSLSRVLDGFLPTGAADGKITGTLRLSE